MQRNKTVTALNIQEQSGFPKPYVLGSHFISMSYQNSCNAGVSPYDHIKSHFFALPRTFPCPFFAFSLSMKSFMMSCNASLRRVIKSTSSVVIVLRPAWREKDSRSADTFSKDPSGRQRKQDGGVLPICAHTISVKAPINCGVALVFRRSDSSSTILPIENQSAALRRCWMSVPRCFLSQKGSISRQEY